MTPTLIYAAAPLSASTSEGRAETLASARRFADWLGCGLGVRLVYCPHVQIAAGHGYPEAGETPETRGAGMARCLAAVGAIARAGGEMHVLLRADGTMSLGCAAEVAHYRDEGGLVVVAWAALDGGYAPREVR